MKKIILFFLLALSSLAFGRDLDVSMQKEINERIDPAVADAKVQKLAHDLAIYQKYYRMSDSLFANYKEKPVAEPVLSDQQRNANELFDELAPDALDETVEVGQQRVPALAEGP